MEESSVPDSKRRKTVDDINSITKLPHDFLSAIADYLPQISRGLLAVALTAPSASFHTTTCSRNYKAELIDTVLNGNEGMPAWKSALNEEDVKDIFAYIEKVNK